MWFKFQSTFKECIYKLVNLSLRLIFLFYVMLYFVSLVFELGLTVRSHLLFIIDITFTNKNLFVKMKFDSIISGKCFWKALLKPSTIRCNLGYQYCQKRWMEFPQKNKQTTFTLPQFKQSRGDTSVFLLGKLLVTS